MKHELKQKEKKAVLALYDKALKGLPNSVHAVAAEMNAVYDKLETTQGFGALMAVAYMAGGIDRVHNIHKRMELKNVKPTSNAQREVMFHVQRWLMDKRPDIFKNHEYLEVYKEFTGWSNLLTPIWHKTDTFKGTVNEWIVVTPQEFYGAVSEFAANKWLRLPVGSPERNLMVKAMPKPSKNKKRNRTYVETNDGKLMQEQRYDGKKGNKGVTHYTKSVTKETANKQAVEIEFLKALSDAMSLPYTQHEGFITFDGVRKLKNKYMAESASTMLATHKIKELDEQAFLEWYSKLTAGDQEKVKRATINPDKTYKTKWENFQGVPIGTFVDKFWDDKNEANDKLLSLTKEQKAEMAPQELARLEKEAKVNTGALLFVEAAIEYFYTPNDRAKALAFEQKVKSFKAPACDSGIVIDTSASMSGRYIQVGQKRINAFQMSLFIAALLVFKNENEDNYIITFSDKARIIYDGQEFEKRSGFYKGQGMQKAKLKGKSFIETYENLKEAVHFDRGCTNIGAYAQLLQDFINTAEDKVEQQFRKDLLGSKELVFIISDGDFNNAWNADQSLKQAISVMKEIEMSPTIFIFDLIDVARPSQFTSDNVIYVGSKNPKLIEEVLSHPDIREYDPNADRYKLLEAMLKNDYYRPIINVASKLY